MLLIIKNPATNQVITTVETDTKASVSQKLQTLKQGQKEWYSQPIEARAAVLMRFHDLLDAHKEDLAAILTAEVGKPLQQSRNEIDGARTRIKWLCDHAAKYLQDDWMDEQADMGERIVYEPLGVVCNISAWNYPYLVGTNVIIPALLAGNAVMYKPSEYATLTGMQIEKWLLEAGIPSNTFATALGAGEMGDTLLELPFSSYFFTGSYKTGNYIYQKVAPKMVPCQLELGGKDPLYVADDVEDIKNVAIGTADGAFYNNGQSCCSVERIYVHENVYDDYVKAFIEEVKTWKIGEPTEGGVYIGPLTREAQLDLLENQVKEALEKGATLALGGKRINRVGNYFEPTVLINVTNDMAVMQEESFGPIIGIMKVKNDDEATVLMNDTPYGLTAAVYSASQKRAESILSHIDSGSGYWNCCDRVSPALPWSGRKNSGVGVTLSHIGLRAFTKPKAYHLKGNWEKSI